MAIHYSSKLMHTIDRSWSREKRRKGCVCTHGKRTFLQKVVISVTVCWVRVGNTSVFGLSLLGGLHWLSIRQSLCVSRSSMPACGLPKDSASSLISASSSSAKASEYRCKHDRTHRVGLRRWPLTQTHPQMHNTSQHPCTFLCKFCGHCGGTAAGSHGSMWVGVVYCSFSAAHFEFRSERDRKFVVYSCARVFVLAVAGTGNCGNPRVIRSSTADRVYLLVNCTVLACTSSKYHIIICFVFLPGLFTR